MGRSFQHGFQKISLIQRYYSSPFRSDVFQRAQVFPPSDRPENFMYRKFYAYNCTQRTPRNGAAIRNVQLGDIYFLLRVTLPKKNTKSWAGACTI